MHCLVCDPPLGRQSAHATSALRGTFRRSDSQETGAPKAGRFQTAKKKHPRSQRQPHAGARAGDAFGAFTSASGPTYDVRLGTFFSRRREGYDAFLG